MTILSASAAAAATSGVDIQVSNITEHVISFGGGAVGLKVCQNGKLQLATNSLGTSLVGLYADITDEWANPRNASLGNWYVVNVSVTSGALTSGATGDQSLGTDREFILSLASVGTVSVVFTLAIKRAGITLDTATMTFQVTVSGI